MESSNYFCNLGIFFLITNSSLNNILCSHILYLDLYVHIVLDVRISNNNPSWETYISHKDYICAHKLGV